MQDSNETVNDSSEAIKEIYLATGLFYSSSTSHIEVIAEFATMLLEYNLL